MDPFFCAPLDIPLELLNMERFFCAPSRKMHKNKRVTASVV